ncbi:MAG: FkbM family methyltransferase [Clostridia bacterium]|nr:FkbM family methyltransferase [Clostridia bacterium]
MNKLLSILNVKPLQQSLKETDKPILLYGMGNGADMIIKVLESYGITYEDTFASDGFVRGHSFHGKRVLSFSEAKEKYGDFVIIVTFAVHDDKTMNFISELSNNFELYAPTVSVVDGSPFTLEFFKENEENFHIAYEMLSDEKSKVDFLNILRFKLSGDVKYLLKAHSEKMKLYEDVLPLSEDETIFDLGAYDGDTIREFLSVTDGKYKKIIALEPDEKNFRKLERKTEGLNNITRLNMGAWDKEETLYFAKKSGRNSRLEDGGVPVHFTSVDNIATEEVTFIKMDIEGAELKALEGAKNTVAKYRPKLYVCAYHRNEDMFALPFKIKKLYEGYKIYFRQHPYIPAWESNFYAIP